MNIIFTPTAWEQYTEWIRTDRKIIKRINDLIKSIERDGLLTGIGKPEPLKHRKACSRRITDEHRLIYNFPESVKFILFCNQLSKQNWLSIALIAVFFQFPH